MRDTGRISQPVWRWEEHTPNAPALRQGERVLTFRELAEAVRQTRAVLVGLGIGPGDRLMLVNENCIELCVLILAAAELDAWPAIINARLTAHEIDAIRDHCRPRRVIYTDGVSADAARHAERNRAIPTGLPGLGAIAVGALDDSAPAESADLVAALIYTSGTMGTPKGVMLTHGNLRFVAEVSGRGCGLHADDLVYGVLPISHVFGLSSVFLATLQAGGCLMTVPRFSPDRLLADLDTGITVLKGVPAMYAKMIEQARPLLAHKLRYISAGGSPLDPTIKAGAEALFGISLHNGYGLTESAPTICQTDIANPRSDCSVGQPLPGVEVRILDKEGHPVPTGEVGALWSRGPGLMKGYYRDPERTREAIDPDGWLDTGDFARQDGEGALFIVGRAKELIIHSGFNVYPAEVEAVLNTYPGVTQSAVVGRVLGDGNEDVIAFVQVGPGITLSPKALAHYVALRLAAYKRPSEIVVMAQLPASATGKVLKQRLVEMANSSV